MEERGKNWLFGEVLSQSESDSAPRSFASGSLAAEGVFISEEKRSGKKGAGGATRSRVSLVILGDRM